MPTVIDISQFLELAQTLPVVDVRSPGEYRQGHVAGAVNIPLFDNEERAVVGTTYVQIGCLPLFCRFAPPCRLPLKNLMLIRMGLGLGFDWGISMYCGQISTG